MLWFLCRLCFQDRYTNALVNGHVRSQNYDVINLIFDVIEVTRIINMHSTTFNIHSLHIQNIQPDALTLEINSFCAELNGEYAGEDFLPLR